MDLGNTSVSRSQKVEDAPAKETKRKKNNFVFYTRISSD